MTHTATDKRNALNATTKAEQKLAARIAALPHDSDEAQELLDSVTNLWVIDLAEILQDEADQAQKEANTPLDFATDFTVTDEQIAAVNTRKATTMQTTSSTGREHIEAGDELELYAVNTAEIYPTLEAIHHVAQRRYDRLTKNEAENVADNVFQHCRPMVRKWLDTAAIQYSRELPNSPYPKFTNAAKDYAANSISIFVLEEAQAGNFR